MTVKNLFLAFGLFTCFLSSEFAIAQNCEKLLSTRQLPAVATKPYIIVVSGPSGSGKTTFAKMLLNDIPSLKISVSSTTRPIRGKEVNGVDYHFLTKDEFLQKIENGAFAEWALVHGNYYGTEVSPIQDALSARKSILALVDFKGAMELKNRFPDQTRLIFLAPPDLETLEARLRSRATESEAALQLRIQNAADEMKNASSYDRVIINGELPRAYSEFKDYILSEELAAP